MANGGIIGPVNNPTADLATGVWELEEQYQAQVGGIWPPIPAIGLNSCRFNSASSDYLSKSVSASNRTTWTWSSWVKRSKLGANEDLFSSYADANNYTDLRFFGTNDNLQFRNLASGSFVGRKYTNAQYRDPSAWYHIVAVWDTTDGTAADRQRLYVNGERLTSFLTTGNPSSSGNSQINASGSLQIGSQNAADFFNGYISETIFVDGTALEPTSFGESDANGFWKPIIPAVPAYGTNGFRLKFEDAASLGTDSSPNGNNFTVNNLTSIDQSTDYPVNNFCTMSPLTLSTDATLSEGNCNVTYGTAATRKAVFGTFAPESGKWYWETKITATSQAAVEINLGISNTMNPALIGNALVSTNGYAISYFNGGYIYTGTTQAQTGLGNLAVNDIIGHALDLSANTLQFYKNGSTLGSAQSITSQTSGEMSGWTPAVACSSGGQTFTAGYNFGSPTFSISSGNADGNGYGDFEYAPPSGFLALCTANLSEELS